MILWTIVPVKPFKEGKSRLAGYISPQTRGALNRDLLTRTLDAIRLGQIDAEIIVVSRDNDALDFAARLGSHALTEQRTNPLSRGIGPHAVPAASEPQLYAALTQAACYVVARGTTKVLFCPPTCPT